MHNGVGVNDEFVDLVAGEVVVSGAKLRLRLLLRGAKGSDDAIEGVGPVEVISIAPRFLSIL